MLLLRFLDILVISLLNVEYSFLHFVSYKQRSHLSSNFTKQSLLNTFLKNITLFSSIAHGFFNILTAQMVNDLHDSQNKKPKNPFLKSKSLDHLSDTSTNLINHSTGITSPPPFYTKRPKEHQLPKFKLFPKRHHFSHPKFTLQPSTLPASEQHPSLPNYSTTNSHPNDNLATQHDNLLNASVTSNTDTPIKLSLSSAILLNYRLELSLSLLDNSRLEHFTPPL